MCSLILGNFAGHKVELCMYLWISVRLAFRIFSRAMLFSLGLLGAALLGKEDLILFLHES